MGPISFPLPQPKSRQILSSKGTTSVVSLVLFWSPLAGTPTRGFDRLFVISNPHWRGCAERCAATMERFRSGVHDLKVHCRCFSSEKPICTGSYL